MQVKSVVTLFASLFVMMIASGAQAQQWYTPSCADGTLKSKSGNQFNCEKTTSSTPSCASGYTLKTNGTGKDKCEKMIETLSSPKCKLAVGNSQSNWKIVVKSGADHCEHKEKNKGVQPIKCEGGATLATDKSGNTDRCVKSSQDSKTVACPSGANHKVAGADKCESTTYSKPKF